MEEKTLSIPALRSSFEEILNDHDLIASQKLFTEIFGSIAGISAVINNNRQIVYANDTFLEFLGIKSLEPVLGKRTGEVISCINSEDGSSGCGTSDACNYCGAVNAIFQSQETNHKTVRETSISSVVDGEHEELGPENNLYPDNPCRPGILYSFPSGYKLSKETCGS